MASLSRNSTLTPCRSPTPEMPIQPDHFYSSQSTQLPPSPNSDGKPWLDPEDDPLAHRGIPVFKPTMAEFQDFEGYMNRVECWGSKSGIVKVIPPKEWTESLPDLKPQLSGLKIKTPIEQHMLGRGGLFRQENMEKRKFMSVREWVELCNKDEFRAPGINEVGLSSRGNHVTIKTRPTRRLQQKGASGKAEPSGPATKIMIKEEPVDESPSLSIGNAIAVSPPNSDVSPHSPKPAVPKTNGKKKKPIKVEEPKPRAKRVGQTREVRQANLADRAARDEEFLETFDPHQGWLPPETASNDYTPEFCQKLERHYWRNCGLGKPAWYGADTQGSLFTDATSAWNVAHLPSALCRLLPASDRGLPGVNTPYLYFGMWRATFAWHVEDMDLFSINYIHFGAPKFWYAIPQGRAKALEQVMRGYFPKDTSQCPQFLRHKSFLASPTLLANSACRPNHLVQQPGEFVITFPHGYHAGFNLGLNCAESVNFALESWLDLGRKAKVCKCIPDSVRIDVDALLREREQENAEFLETKKLVEGPQDRVVVKDEREDGIIPPLRVPSRKRKADLQHQESPNPKKAKVKAANTSPSKASSFKVPTSKAAPIKLSVTLKLGPRPTEPECFPCCLCVSTNREGLLKVHDPPLSRRDAIEAASHPAIWMAHELCAKLVPETWVDEVPSTDGRRSKLVFGVDGIVKDRWHLKCAACTKAKARAHGAPIQCTKGKCPKAFHVNCAKDGSDSGIVFADLREVEKEVVLIDTHNPAPSNPGGDMQVDSSAPDSISTMDDRFPAHNTKESHVLKVIKKLEAQILCVQHNPAVAAKKKASKQDKIRSDLLALPSMARIKIRVSSGVFEVSLIRVIEATSSVEVLWDKGVKREFKWGSVVFGSTDGPIQQKPSEVVIEPGPSSTAPFGAVMPLPSVAASAEQPTTAVPSSSSTQPATIKMRLPITPQHYMNPNTFMYPTHPGAYNYWPYPSQQVQYTGQYPYTYSGYYPMTPMGGPSQNYFGYPSTYDSSRMQSAQLHWQQPYQGPSKSQENSGTAQFGSSSSQPLQNAQTPGSQPQSCNSPANDASRMPTPHPPSPSQSGSSSAPTNGVNPASPATMTPEQQAAYKDLATLSSLPPEQIAEALRSNPQLRNIVLAAVDQAAKGPV